MAIGYTFRLEWVRHQGSSWSINSWKLDLRTLYGSVLTDPVVVVVVVVAVVVVVVILVVVLVVVLHYQATTHKKMARSY